MLDLFLVSRRIGPPGYMKRWHVLTLGPLVEVYLHRFEGADPDRNMHDHPWLANLTIVLSGGYTEVRPCHKVDRLLPEITGTEHRMITRGSVRLGRAIHTIAKLWPTRDDGAVWTLFIGLGRWRVWGFYPRAGGFVPYSRYKEGKPTA